MILWSSVAWACSFPGSTEFFVDPAAPAEAPSPIAVAVEVTRGRGPRVGLGTFAVSSCDDLGRIELDIQGAGPDEGVQVVALPDGVWPDGLDPGSVEGTWAGDLQFVWIDGRARVQEPFAFALELTPISASGVLGDAFDVEVSDAGTPKRGCDLSGGAGSAALAGFAAAATRMRRRRLG